MKIPSVTAQKIRHAAISAMRTVVLLAALAVMVALSIDTFNPHHALSNGVYMQIQLVVCIVFLADYFLEIALSPRPWHYLLTHIPYLILSIPYYNILHWTGLSLPYPFSYFLTFVPTARAALAFALLIGYISRNKIIGLFTSYLCIVLLTNYFASMIFLEVEQPVNPDVTSYRASLWWCSLQTTTLGAPFFAKTTVGKTLAIILSTMGILMFPLFTVYLTNIIKGYIKNTAKTPAAESKN